MLKCGFDLSQDHMAIVVIDGTRNNCILSPGNKNATHEMDGKSQDDNQIIYIVLKVHLQMQIAEDKEISIKTTFKMYERKLQCFFCSSGYCICL